MLSKKFTARTKSGLEIILEARNTEKGLKTNFKTTRVSGGTHVIELTSQQAKDLLNANVPKAYIVIEDQKGWSQFVDDCLREQYEAEQAKPKSLKEQREALRSAEYNLYSDEHFPGSKAWQKWQEALTALNEFDAAHPEIKAEIEAEQDREREARLKNINIWNL